VNSKTRTLTHLVVATLCAACAVNSETLDEDEGATSAEDPTASSSTEISVTSQHDPTQSETDAGLTSEPPDSATESPAELGGDTMRDAAVNEAGSASVDPAVSLPNNDGGDASPTSPNTRANGDAGTSPDSGVTSVADCETREVDWNQFFPDEYGYGSVQRTDYVDTDGNGSKEAFAFLEGSWGGTASGAFWVVKVFEFDDLCQAHPVGSKAGEPFAAVNVTADGVYQLEMYLLAEEDPACCPSLTQVVELRLVDGELQEFPLPDP
jgi:hypothetical protein